MSKNVRPIAIALGVFGLFLGAAWLHFAGDPLGGEPIAELNLTTPDAAGIDLGFAPTSARSGQETIDVTSNYLYGENSETIETASPITEETLPGGAKVIIIEPDADLERTGLGPVPAEQLIERAPNGLLPIRADNGTSPMTEYARPYAEETTASSRPRIAIMVNAMGLNQTQSTEAIRRLPGQVSFAYAPYANGLQEWVSRSRQDGHEVLLQVPMEPFDFPDNDPGPHTLLTSLTPQQNLERLHWVMTRMVGYVGLTNFMGARYTASREMMRPFLLELKKRGLLYVDDGSSPRSLAEDLASEVGLPARRAQVVLDAIPAPEAIGAALERLEIEAFQNGVAIGVISALPVSIDTVGDWIEGLDARGIDLIPVSAATRIVAEG
ncbi:MAG: divergent polysaccharide deacetylase family protein [Pseudomonadota bacterium]